MPLGNRERLTVLAIGLAAGALAYHLSLTQPWNRGAGGAR